MPASATTSPPTLAKSNWTLAFFGLDDLASAIVGNSQGPEAERSFALRGRTCRTHCRSDQVTKRHDLRNDLVGGFQDHQRLPGRQGNHGVGSGLDGFDQIRV